ncbi:MAG: hypothetical protein ACOYMR_04090 [Ilumatobacteraceae bacterium]
MSDDSDIIQIEADGPGEKPAKFTPWERRLVSAIEVADAARVGVVILRVVAAVSAAAAILGLVLLIFFQNAADSPLGSGGLGGRQQWGQFLQSVATPLAFAGIVFGLSYVVQIAAARLDVDIVMADADETEA